MLSIRFAFEHLNILIIFDRSGGIKFFGVILTSIGMKTLGYFLLGIAPATLVNLRSYLRLGLEPTKRRLAARKNVAVPVATYRTARCAKDIETRSGLRASNCSLTWVIIA